MFLKLFSKIFAIINLEVVVCGNGKILYTLLLLVASLMFSAKICHKCFLKFYFKVQVIKCLIKLKFPVICKCLFLVEMMFVSRRRSLVVLV